METTTKEIQNIKNIIEWGHKINEEKHKRLEIIEKKNLKGRIQNIINKVKEIDQRNKAIVKNELKMRHSNIYKLFKIKYEILPY